MNVTNENFDFTGGWQEDLFADTTTTYLDSSYPNVSGGQFDTVGLYQEPGSVSSPDGWLTAHSPWLQHDSGSMYGGSSTADVEYTHSFPSYTTAQGPVYDGMLNELSDVDQSTSHSSFSESDIDQLYISHRTNAQARNLRHPPTSSPITGDYQHHPLPSTSQPSRHDLQTHGLSLEHLTPSTPATQPPRLHIPPQTHNTTPNDPLHPRQQPPRWIGDLYTPTYVRGDGSNRAGWCGHCASWLTLKDSAYWYHMHFAHGISCATGAYLPNPVRLRPTVGAARGVGDAEALCRGCSRWVLVVMGEKGRTAWFRHAYRCLLKPPQARERRRGKSASPRKVVARPVLGGDAGSP